MHEFRRKPHARTRGRTSRKRDAHGPVYWIDGIKNAPMVKRFACLTVHTVLITFMQHRMHAVNMCSLLLHVCVTVGHSYELQFVLLVIGDASSSFVH